MTKTEINGLPSCAPRELQEIANGARVYDSSSSPSARVYFIDRDGGYYLKRSAPRTLEREAQMTSYFHSLCLAPRVLSYVASEEDWMLTERAVGEDMTNSHYLSEPKRLAALLGERLRILHEIDYGDCPVVNKTQEYIEAAVKKYREGRYDASHFPDSFGYRSAEQAYAVLSECGGALCADTLTHGDFCLPNVMLDSWRFSAFIDLGNAGVADRHIDLFWGAWSLGFNLKTDAYRDVFFDSYGRDKIDLSHLQIVAAAEVFG